MIKNQLVIYRTFATQQYIIDVHQSQEQIQIRIPSTVKMEHITSNYPFTISNHQILIVPKVETVATVSNAIDETTEKDMDKLIENIEIIIKYSNIKWKTIYNFFKNTNTLICYASITNETKYDIHTNDIKVVFRSIDHEYDIHQPKNLNIDIPTFHTKNIVQFDLKDILETPFTLSEHTNIEIWRHIVNCKEIYQHYLKDIHQVYCDSFVIMDTPEILLPGHLEIYERTDENDILCLGSINIKLYKKGQKLKIHFPKNKFLKLKNETTQKNHSFFIHKTFHTFRSKIKKFIEGNAIIHFYMEESVIKNPSQPASFHEEGYSVWEIKCEDKETFFELNLNIEA